MVPEYSVRVEEGYLEDAETFHPAGPQRTRDTVSRAVLSATLTFTLGILGSSILPVPYAISQVGVATGVGTMIVVALMNSYTCELLVNSSSITGRDSYEQVTNAACGRYMKVVAQVSLVLLMFGNLTGSHCLLANVGRSTLKSALGSAAPALLVEAQGRGIMTLLSVAVIFPLCCLRRIRQLEAVGSWGLFIAMALVAIVLQRGWATGFPALQSGDLPIWPSPQMEQQLPASFAILGFAFYIQPMVMPLLHEMPKGARGASQTVTALRITILGCALLVYSLVGVAAAATFGHDTQEDVMMNRIIVGRAFSVAASIIITAYLAVSIPPIHFALRCTLDELIAGPSAAFNARRYYAETMLAVFGSLSLALIAPNHAAKVFEITGAIPVCLVCYVIPILVSQNLKARLRARAASEPYRPLLEDAHTADAAAAAAAADGNGWAPEAAAPVHLRSSWLGRAWWDVLVPYSVLLIGCGLSAAALYSSVAPLLGWQR